MTHPLATLPTATLFRFPDAAPRVLIAMISRGLAPLTPLADAQRVAQDYGCGFAVIAGFPAVEGKNRAAGLALELDAAMLLVEDDTLADDETWAAALAPSMSPLPVRLATARCRDGSANTKFHADGSVLYSGTPFVLIPYDVLMRLAMPIFVANEYGIADGELFLRGPSRKGHGSDVHLWATLRQLEPRPAVEIIGEVTCLTHRLNRESHDLQTAEVVGVV